MTAVTKERDAAFHSAAELREVLERLLRAVDSDERLGPLLRAARVRTCLEFTDHGLTLNVASADDEDERHIEWSFARRPPWQPKVVMKMDSQAANRWLQGRQSLAIAIARGQVRCTGETRSTLFFIPVAKLLTEPYRHLIETEYDHLRLA